tara:strand:- start:20 stop:370 length:351 start_codon:yes stop_codon:yes gene_type:complete
MAGKGITTYNEQEAHNIGLGQVGSIHVSGTNAVTTAVPNTVFVAITFLEDTVFDSAATGLVAESPQLWADSTYTSTDIDADGGGVTDGETFPKGITIYGRWTGFHLTSGKVIAYIG